ncbi:hypothetical protein VM1G_11692 [Cytospora mali]|uniref:Uncharacterized protein n=1 Tax=Cytospora mali TaxID=578113 RepID=A0A194W278_CYTMA|nr:hypothetical protein VM1G_11692 [Valsa mali]
MDNVDFAEPEQEEDRRSAFLQSFPTQAPDVPPTRYTAVLQGSYRVPECEGGLHNVNAEETAGILNFKDSEMCEFVFSFMPTFFNGSPTLSLDGNAKGYKDVFEEYFEMTRDDFDPSRKRKRTA